MKLSNILLLLLLPLSASANDLPPEETSTNAQPEEHRDIDAIEKVEDLESKVKIEGIEITEELAKGDFKPSAKINVVDKSLGKTHRLTINVGDVSTIGSITIKVNKCWQPNQAAITNEARAHIQVTKSNGYKMMPIYSGWTFSNAPALGYINDDKFDVILSSCN